MRSSPSRRAVPGASRPMVSRSVAALEAEVAELRRERDRYQKVQDSNTIDLASLQKQVDGLDDRSVVVDDTVRGLHPQIGLGL